MARIETLAELKAIYGDAKERSLQKELDVLDVHMRRFINLCPFCLLGTNDGKGNADVTPRGDRPGFVKILDERTLLLPDRPGNRRIDTLSNIIHHSAIGMLFLIPGVNETLRVNGDAEIRDDEDLLMQCRQEEKHPQSVMLIHIQSAYLHCPKAFMRSNLWGVEAQIRRDVLPTFGEMLKDQIGMSAPAESESAMLERYNKALW